VQPDFFGINRRALLFTIAALPTPAWLGTTSALAQDTANQLPSWNDGPAKQRAPDVHTSGLLP
jgi:hypothetical protein